MTSTFLKRYYFDDRKLLQRTFLELVRALDSDRLVAVTGSMATEAAGYPSWSGFRRKYLKEASRLVDPSHGGPGVPAGLLRTTRRVMDGLRGEYVVRRPKLDSRVAMSAAKETLRVVDDQRRPHPDRRLDDIWHPKPHSKPPAAMSLTGRLDALAAVDFKDPPRTAINGFDLSLRLMTELGISRFVTLNYDFELERAAILRSRDALEAAEPGYAPIARMIREGIVQRDDRVRHRLTCTLPDGTTVDSDVFDRERPDRLIEFAIHSAHADTHVFHLHGRACTPSTMVVGTRDYDQMYRQTHPSRLPFREGLRLLFAGNPILFVGLGMSEAEVNETLRTFVSDNPYRYQAPIFLIWNTYGNSKDPEEHARQKRVARLDWLMRLGVFVIFDDELPKLAERARDLRIDSNLEPAPRGLRERKLELLADTVTKLADDVVAIRLRSRQVGERFRDTGTRIERSLRVDKVSLRRTPPFSPEDPRKLRLWVPEKPDEDPSPPVLPEPRPGELKVPRYRPLVLVGRHGAGKGALARRLFETDYAPELPHRLLVNASFCYDTDSLADVLVRFLGKLHLIGGGRFAAKNQRLSREQLLEDPKVFRCEKALVVINGIDRFFTNDGHPLSVEFDQLLRVLTQSPQGGGDLRFVLLGTERVRRYFNTIGECDMREMHAPAEGSRYLGRLLENFPPPNPAASARIAAATATSTSSHAYRQAVVATVLEPSSLGTTDVDAGLAQEILRTLAFIGMPVEAVVLLHAPSVRILLLKHAAEIAETSPGSALEDLAAAELVQAMAKLAKKRVAIEFTRFDDYPGSRDPDGNPLWRRYGLHRTILSELRERFGVPLSRSKRATAFNMSLYTAQPVDSDTPEASTHDELALLIDRLIGSYKDASAKGECPGQRIGECRAVLNEQGDASRPPLQDGSDVLQRLLWPASVATLRAALAVVRGYYSTTTLLSIDRGQRLASPDRDGALLEHAERLERLLRGYRRLTRFREAWVRSSGGAEPAAGDQEAEWTARDARMESLGPEPFYPDEIVWLQNELGTVRLAQGDLYAARSAFDRALEVNQRVEFDDHSHNWRRIMLNAVMVEIERGRLAEAEEHLRQIERTVDERKVPPSPVGVAGSRVKRIVQIFAKPGEHDEEQSTIHPEFLHEEILAVGLVTSMRGLIEHLRGHLRTAKINYMDGIRILRRLGEHRAYALFQRYYAQILRSLGDTKAHKVEIGLAVAAAESVRQLDFAYPARMIDAEPDGSGEGAREYLRQALAAQEYSMLTDNHRVRVDSATRLARAKLASGDYEMALDHATDALATATRFGMSLRKINLRVLLGQILIRRGDRRSGTALIDAAIEQADRIDYQRGVALAQRIRSTEAILF